MARTPPRLWAAAAACSALLPLSPLQAGQISLSIGDIVTPSFRAKAVSATLDPNGAQDLDMRIGELSLAGRIWRGARLQCPGVRLDGEAIVCRQGVLHAGEKIPLAFRYGFADRSLDMTLKPSPGEAWRIQAGIGKNAWNARIGIRNGSLVRLASWLPPQVPPPSRGTLAGEIVLAGGATGMNRLDVELRLAEADFADVSGLHAGEKVSGRATLAAQRREVAWRWQAAADWQGGEIFWQPLYFPGGGHHLAAQGTLEGGFLRVDQGRLHLAEVGAAEIGGTWEVAGRRLDEAKVHARDLDLAAANRLILKPLLQHTAFSQVEVGGRLDADWHYRAGRSRSLVLALRDASLEDGRGRFALQGIQAALPWREDAPGQARITVENGRLQQLPLGKVEMELVLRKDGFSIPRTDLPLLDGKLTIEDFQAEKREEGWRWQFSGGLTPVSMERLSEALKLPRLHGTLSGVIPRVSYAQQALSVEGALLFRLFDGTAVVTDLALLDPLGPAPRLMGNLDMRGLDLDLLTSAFSFGSMQGRIDVSVQGLELANWWPVRFDAEVHSSTGDYPKRISQRAVQNISSLGGASAEVAIQRSFLRFFEQFGYERIGLSCRLRNEVCIMDGIEAAPQGYVIVKGGGIPAITVLGYNHDVDWPELLERLARITRGAAKPVAQ